MSVGIKQLRNMMKMTQEELAERMSVSRQTVAKWENGESVPDIIKCSELAKIFNLSLDDIAAVFIESDDNTQARPKDDFFFGTCVIKNNNIALPESALRQFRFHNGDEFLLLGDSSQSLVLISKAGFSSYASKILSSSFLDSEYVAEHAGKIIKES